MKRIKVLEGEKVALVVPEREDVEVWYRWINNLENQIFLGQRWRIMTLEKEYEYYDKLDFEQQKTFSIMALEEKEIIWSFSLMNISFFDRVAFMWIMICDNSYKNKWFGRETVKLILKYWFEVLGLHKIKLEYLSTNIKAKKVYEKSWFKECWVWKEDIFDWEKYVDKVCMEILRTDYFTEKD